MNDWPDRSQLPVCLRCDLQMQPVDSALAAQLRVTHRCVCCGVYTSGQLERCDNRRCCRKYSRGHLQLINEQGAFIGLNHV